MKKKCSIAIFIVFALFCVSCSAVRHAKSAHTMLTGDGIGGWGYVLELGGPKEITEWALKQKDMRKVCDARDALASLWDTKDENQAFASIYGYTAIHIKLESGWDGLYESNRNMVLKQEVDKEIRRTYGVMARMSEEKLITAYFFYYIKPNKWESDKIKLWQNLKREFNVGTRLQGGRSEDIKSALGGQKVSGTFK